MVTKSALSAAVLGVALLAGASGQAQQAPIAPSPAMPPSANPLDNVPDKMPFDVPYGAPITLARAVAAISAAAAEAAKHDWKLNIAVADSGGNLVAFERMDGAQLASIQVAEHKARATVMFRRETKAFENGLDAIDGRKNKRDGIGCDRHPVAELAHQVFGGVRQRFQPRQTEEAAGSLDGVHQTKDVIQNLGVVLILLEPHQLIVDGIQALAGFRQKLSQKIVHEIWPSPTHTRSTRFSSVDSFYAKRLILVE